MAIDKSKLSKQELYWLEQGEHAVKHLKSLEGLASQLKELSKNSKDTATQKLLEQIRREVSALKSKEIPVPPAPVVNVPAPVVKLPAPVVNVPAPKVEVKPADVKINLDPVTKAIKDQKFPDFPRAMGVDLTFAESGKPVEAKHAMIDVTERGDNLIVKGVKGKSIRLISVFLMTSHDCFIGFGCECAHPLSGTLPPKNGGGFVLPYNPAGWTQTEPGHGLILTCNHDGQMGGMITYVEV